MAKLRIFGIKIWYVYQPNEHLEAILQNHKKGGREKISFFTKTEAGFWKAGPTRQIVHLVILDITSPVEYLLCLSSGRISDLYFFMEEETINFMNYDLKYDSGETKDF